MSGAVEVGKGLALRALRDDRDRERFAALSANYNNPAEGATCACLLHHHPATTLDDYWVVEDTGRDEVVSTTCLLPWDCSFGGVHLRVAQLEMVLTHPDYRGRGLVRTQMEHFDQIVQQRAYDLSIIWGIPYYYRQFGYSYAIEGEVFRSLPAWNIPEPAKPNMDLLRLRPAVCADIPALDRFYRMETVRLAFSVERPAAYWEYLIQWARRPIHLLENAFTGEALGYVELVEEAGQVKLLESAVPAAQNAVGLLQRLKARGHPRIDVFGPDSASLAQTAQALKSTRTVGGQWLVRVPNLPHFLEKITPILEQRLSQSAWNGYSGSLTINLYRQAYRLNFEAGKLTRTDALGFVDTSMGADGGDLCIPTDAFIRLLVGFRGLEELADAWPDISVKPAARSLVDSLFARQDSYLFTPYHFMGLGQK